MRTCTIVGGSLPNTECPLPSDHNWNANMHLKLICMHMQVVCVLCGIVLPKNRQSLKIPNKAETDRKGAEECQVNAMKRSLLRPLGVDRPTTLPFGCQQFGTTANRFHWLLLLLLLSCCRVFKLLLQPEKVVQSKQENNRESQQVLCTKICFYFNLCANIFTILEDICLFVHIEC